MAENNVSLKVTEASPPKRMELFQYGLLALPLAFAGLPLYIHAPDFYTRDLGMNIGLIGIILLAVRLVDAVQDPYIGYLSDKFADRRAKIVMLGAALLMGGMGAVFYGPPEFVPTPLWFTLSMILATTGFSIITINLNMIGGFWHSDPAQRTRISAWREAAALVGLVIAAVLPTVLQNFKPAEIAFRMLFWIFSVMMIAGFIMFSRFMGRISPGHLITKSSPQKGLSFFKILIGKDKGFFLVCFLTHLAASMPGVMVLYFMKDYLGAEGYEGLFLCLYFISGAVLMPLWVKLAGKIGKEQAWLSSMFLAMATFMWAFMLQPGDLIAYGIICVLSGMALGADLALPPSILADKIEANDGQDAATQNYALLAFIPKMGIAIASGVSFVILDSFGFVAGAENSGAAQNSLLYMYALIPCLVKLMAAGLLWRLLLNKESKSC